MALRAHLSRARAFVVVPPDSPPVSGSSRKNLSDKSATFLRRTPSRKSAVPATTSGRKSALAATTSSRLLPASLGRALAQPPSAQLPSHCHCPFTQTALPHKQLKLPWQPASTPPSVASGRQHSCEHPPQVSQGWGQSLSSGLGAGWYPGLQPPAQPHMPPAFAQPWPGTCASPVPPPVPLWPPLPPLPPLLPELHADTASNAAPSTHPRNTPIRRD